MDKFYGDFLKMLATSTKEEIKAFKDNYIKSRIKDEYIYKFVKFTDNSVLNDNKISLVKCEKLWVSSYNSFSDKDKLELKCNQKKIAKKSRLSIDYVAQVVLDVKQMNDVASFTFEYNDLMWEKFTDSGNGFCLKFKLLNSCKFFPVEYVNDTEYDFTLDFISVLKNKDNIDEVKENLARILPYPCVLKDESFSEENELRFLCEDIKDDECGAIGERIFEEKKEKYNYSGTSYDYDDVGIQLCDIILGDNCDINYRTKLEKIKENL